MLFRSQDLWDEQNKLTVKECDCGDTCICGKRTVNHIHIFDIYKHGKFVCECGVWVGEEWTVEDEPGGALLNDKINKQEKIEEIIKHFSKRFFIQDGCLVEELEDDTAHSASIKDIKSWPRDKLKELIK